MSKARKEAGDTARQRPGRDVLGKNTPGKESGPVIGTSRSPLQNRVNKETQIASEVRKLPEPNCGRFCRSLSRRWLLL